MSRKIEKTDPNLSPFSVDNFTGEVTEFPRYRQPVLNKAGMEMPSAITLVAVPAARDFDMGHRIRRYQRAPESVQARLDEQYDPDDADFDNHVDTEDENPMTRHELRYGDVLSTVADKLKENIKIRDEQKAAKLKAKKEAFQAQFKALQEEGTIPATSPTPPPAKGA